MGVSLNMALGDGSVVALWRITGGDGKSLGEQRLAVNALIDSVFDGQFRLCHDDEGVPVLETVSGAKAGRRRTATSRAAEKGEPSVPFVSVSHTRGWVAVMTNPKEHVGIDIELLDRDFSAVAKKAMSDSELARLDSWAEVLGYSLPPHTNADPSGTTSPLTARNTVLGLIWCAKESVYKRLTVPATDFANQIEIESIVPTSTATTREESTLLCEPRAGGGITAIFKHRDGVTTEIRLEYYIISGLLLVYTK